MCLSFNTDFPKWQSIAFWNFKSLCCVAGISKTFLPFNSSCFFHFESFRRRIGQTKNFLPPIYDERRENLAERKPRFSKKQFGLDFASLWLMLNNSIWQSAKGSVTLTTSRLLTLETNPLQSEGNQALKFLEKIPWQELKRYFCLARAKTWIYPSWGWIKDLWRVCLLSAALSFQPISHENRTKRLGKPLTQDGWWQLTLHWHMGQKNTYNIAG